MQNTRDKIQTEAVSFWNGSGTIVLPTGVGKTKVGVTIASKFKRVLVVTPTVVLLNQWKNEFKKWNVEVDLDVKCLKSAHKLTNEYDLLIIDEIHTALSPIYRQIFNNIKYQNILGLTATVPENTEYLKYLNVVCPVIYVKNIDDAKNSKSISEFKVYNLEVTLSKKDSAKYKLFDGKFKRAQYNIGIEKKKFPHLKGMDTFSIAQKYATSINTDPAYTDLVRYSKDFWSSMNLRKRICYEAESKFKYVVDIISRFPDRKWILFNKSIAYTEALSAYLLEHNLLNKIYHSKIKKEEKENILAEFEKSEFKILAAVDALNAGLNIPDTDSAICLSGVSTELVSTQQLGRTTRRTNDDKVALFINFYSRNTVEENWVRTKTAKMNPIWINNSTKIIP